MPLQRVDYAFTARLPAPRSAAFRWATDYQPGDLALMGFDARRRVEWLTRDTVLLTDTFASDPFAIAPGGRVTKVKLVHLFPQRWSWTSTHITGPTKYSQFLYELVPAGRNACRLRYTGVQVEQKPRAGRGPSIAQRARDLTREDSQGWRHLAAAIGRELR
ncbi:MAG: hypothetical protein L3J68_02860 [Thermoplasmata archaeon]|nr:hypothetical protein [Thermoplasmata archaeon]